MIEELLRPVGDGSLLIAYSTNSATKSLIIKYFSQANKTDLMPIFMDRHDVSEVVTAENVARIHQEDLKIQDEYGCRGLTYWFDGKRKTAFCLIEAPDKESIQHMHNKAHGDVPNYVIEVEPGIVESFLGRIEDPEKAQNTELNIIDDTAFRTIMVITFTRLKGRQRDFDKSKPGNESCINDIAGVIEGEGGNIVKQAEDGLLVSFKSVSRAVRTAFQIQKKLKLAARSAGDDGMLFKIALAAGAPVTEKKLIFEDTIRLANRMCRIVKGEIIVTAEVEELYNNENRERLSKGENAYSLTKADEDFLNALMDYTELHWNDSNLKVDDFTRPIACSKSQLYRKMISLTGKSPNAFINDYRLDEAVQLLNENTNNVSEIAFKSGFSSPSYFSKRFYRRFGHQPSDNRSRKAV
jgi:AraC-like DNA-binding protein